MAEVQGNRTGVEGAPRMHEVTQVYFMSGGSGRASLGRQERSWYHWWWWMVPTRLHGREPPVALHAIQLQGQGVGPPRWVCHLLGL